MPNTSCGCGIVIFNGYTANNVMFKPMIRLASESDATFAPWENLCPITGWTGCEVKRTGLNLISPNRTSETNYGVTFTVNADKSITVSGTASQTTGFRLFDYINRLNLQIGKTYHIKLLTDKASTIQIQVYKNGSFAVASYPNQDLVYTVPSDSVTNYVRIRTGGGESFDNVTCKVMITLDEEATEYVPPVENIYPVSWQDDAGTVYGGTVDVVSGVLTVNKIEKTLSDVDTIYTTSRGTGKYVSWNVDETFDNSKVLLCDRMKGILYADRGNAYEVYLYKTSGGAFRVQSFVPSDATVQSVNDAISGAKVIVTLATPTTYQLDPVQVALLIGHNNVWNNVGDTSIEVGNDPNYVINPTRFEAQPLLEVEGYGTINIGNGEITIHNEPIGDVLLVNISRYDRTVTKTIQFNTQFANVGDLIECSEFSLGGGWAIDSGTFTGEWDDDSVAGYSYDFSDYVWFENGNKWLKFNLWKDNVVFTYGTATTLKYGWELIPKTTAYSFISGGYQLFTIDYDGAGTITFTANITMLNHCSPPNPNVYWLEHNEIILHSTQTNLGNPLYVDLGFGEAYKIEGGSSISINNGVVIPAELPTLEPGSNEITFSNTYTDVKVIPRWWKV